MRKQLRAHEVDVVQELVRQAFYRRSAARAAAQAAAEIESQRSSATATATAIIDSYVNARAGSSQSAPGALGDDHVNVSLAAVERFCKAVGLLRPPLHKSLRQTKPRSGHAAAFPASLGGFTYADAVHLVHGPGPPEDAVQESATDTLLIRRDADGFIMRCVAEHELQRDIDSNRRWLGSINMDGWSDSAHSRGPSKEQENENINSFAIRTLRGRKGSLGRGADPENDEMRTGLYEALKNNMHTEYAGARAIKRRIVYHYGPTNSGKTHSALQRLCGLEGGDGEAPARRDKSVPLTGLYAGPLRLLAQELHERMNDGGVHTNLKTGQEQVLVPFATHVACTVEMVDLATFWDVAVIDEVQLIANPQRGWAWTRALMGLQCPEIHVCGDASALALVRRLARQCGDSFSTQAYERRNPLRVASKTLKGDCAKVQKGDCVVVFSRDLAYQMRELIEQSTKLRCCIVYGRLPPHVRAQQARLFNDPRSNYDVLVATDAIGMGLNLNIARIVFSSMSKHVMCSVQRKLVRRELEAPLVRQIAGRAGRDVRTFLDGGVVTALFDQDRRLLTENMKHALDYQSKRAGVMPSAEQLMMIWKHLYGDTSRSREPNFETFAARLDANPSSGRVFLRLLREFMHIARHKESEVMGGTFELAADGMGTALALANLLADVDGISVEARIDWLCCPVDERRAQSKDSFKKLAECYAAGVPAEYDMRDVYLMRSEIPAQVRDHASMSRRNLELEGIYSRAETYIFLSRKFGPGCFPSREFAHAIRDEVANKIQENLIWRAKKRSQGAASKHHRDAMRATLARQLGHRKDRAESKKKIKNKEKDEREELRNIGMAMGMNMNLLDDMDLLEKGSQKKRRKNKKTKRGKRKAKH
ncbi:DExH-box ATP-dependent RNA helicase DExH18, mitochondrial [Porphyridium purpureum]|uniref:RNA helicase n=1 Tax=Porphyridium purpureum TaxID=35688 RepID=A0A5J4YLF8_PORPP|nr:DExH-box ATP-dependent RNA helicase DExH18, mitochondrial [Porphyridium purpureum]|eukprot:POR6338..scf291_13